MSFCLRKAGLKFLNSPSFEVDMKQALKLLRELLIKNAQDQMKFCPQYRNYFDDWVLVKVTKEIKTKLGLAFDEDEISIAIPNSMFPIDFNGMDFTSVWSFKTQITTSVPSKNVTFID